MTETCHLDIPGVGGQWWDPSPAPHAVGESQEVFSWRRMAAWRERHGLPRAVADDGAAS